jgi:hypothetical protein
MFGVCTHHIHICINQLSYLGVGVRLTTLENKLFMYSICILYFLFQFENISLQYTRSSCNPNPHHTIHTTNISIVVYTQTTL